MKTIKQDLGKVSVTCNGTWDGGKEYYRLSIVNDGSYASYISKKFVPSGTPLSNIEYWQPLASLKDDIKINYEKFKKEVLQLIADIQIALRGTRLVVQNEAERNELTWMQVAVGCEVYEIDSKLTYILDSIVPILNIKEWHLESDSRIDSVPMYELEGTFDNLTSDRAIADRWGHIIDEYYVTRNMVNNYIKELVEKYVHEITILPGSIKPEDLSQAVLDLIGHDSITNLADEEDITDHTNANGTHVLKFKDKDYYEADGSGLGRVYLRQNKVQGVNTLTQDMINKPNTIYHIQYEYTLQDQIINLPINSVLLFNGGSINCGTLVGNNSKIIASKEHTIFGTGITISGNWNIADIYDEWFAFDSFENFVSNDIIKNILALGNDNINNTIHFEADRTYYFELPYKGRTNLGDDVRPDYWKLFTDDYAFLRIFTGVTSNTNLIFNNILQMVPTNQGAYSVFYIANKSNIEISGKGSINGDALNHKYTNPFAGTEYYGEFGFIFDFKSCDNIVVKDVTIGYAFGDNILFSNTVQDNNGVKTVGLPTNNVIVNNAKILFARRNGIALGGNNYSISDVYFEGNGSDTIRGTAPKAAIDFENDFLEEPSSISNNITMTSCKFKDNKFDVSSFIYPSIATDITNSVTINNCNFTAPLRLNTITTGMTFNDCHIVGISSHDNSIIPWYNSKNLVFNSCIFDELNPYLSTTAKEQGKTFNNCKFPEDTEYSTIFRVLLNPGKAAKISIPKPIIGEIELSAIGFNSGARPTYLPINHTIYTFGNTQALTNIKDIKLYTNTGTTSRYGLYRSVPVFSNITYTEDADNYNIYFTLGGELISNPYTTISDFNMFLKSKIRYIVITAPITDTPNTQGIYGGKWSEVSAVTISTINVSDIPSTITFPNKDMFPASLLADMPTSLTSDKVGKSIFLLDSDYKRPAFWDSYSSVWRDAAGFNLFERRASSISALNTLTAKLTTTDVGYPCYMSQYGTQLTWDGTKWLNPDGTDFSQVRIITNSTNLATNVSYNDFIYKIVGNIDLGGGELTIVSGCTLDFQGGSITNGTIIGNNTKIIYNKTVFNSCILQGTFNVELITDDIVNNTNDIDKLKNISALASGTNYKKIVLNNDYVVDSFPVDSYALFRLYSNTDLVLNGSISVNNISFPSYNIIFCSNASNINISGGKLVGDIDTHIGETGEFGYGITLASCENVTITDINISKCWGDGIAILRDNWNSPTDVRPCKNVIIENVICDSNRRQGLSIIALDGAVIKNSKFINTGTIKYTAPGYGIDIEPNNQYEEVTNVTIDSCEFINNKDSISNYDKSISLYAPVNKNISNILIQNCITTGELTINGSNNIIVDRCNLYTCSFSNIIFSDNVELLNSIIKRAENYTWRSFMKLTNNIWSFSAKINKIFAPNNTNMKLVFPKFDGFIKLIVISNYYNYIKEVYYNINSTGLIDKKNYTKYINTSSIGPVVNNTIINTSTQFSAPIEDGNNIKILTTGFEPTIKSTIFLEVYSLYTDTSPRIKEADFSLVDADNTEIATGDFKEVLFNPSSIPTSERPMSAQEGYNIYDSTLKRLITWNGTTWVGADGYKALVHRGETVSRPILTTDDLGFMFYDSLLKKPIWWDGTAWKDATGATV